MIIVRAIVFGPFVPAFMLVYLIAGDAHWRDIPRWTWELIRYGYDKAVTLP